MLWGFSPPLDVIAEYSLLNPNNTKEELNVLLVGNADVRHVLKTMAKSYHYDHKIKVNFYIYDGLLEVLARHMLLLTIALEPGDKLGLREKVWLWMETYGNTLLRPTTATYIIKKVPQLVHMVTDLDFLLYRQPCLDLSHLKYKERDTLENIFRFWLMEKFPISRLWDARLRGTLGTRYDSKSATFDWDYHMKMSDIHGAKIINSREYINWRKNGVAFTWPEMEYTIPNPTFALGITNAGDRYRHMGFHGEMIYGPFYTFGTTCTEEKVLKTVSGIHAKRATDITQRNLLEMFHEIESNTGYDHSIHSDDPDYGLAVCKLGSIDIDNKADIPREADRMKEAYQSISTPHRVIFISSEKLQGIIQPSFKHFFDVTIISNCLFTKCSELEGLIGLANDNGIFIIESQRIHFRLDKEKRIKYGDQVTKYFETNGFEKAFDFDPLVDNYYYYQLRNGELRNEKQEDCKNNELSKEQMSKLEVNNTLNEKPTCASASVASNIDTSNN